MTFGSYPFPQIRVLQPVHNGHFLGAYPHLHFDGRVVHLPVGTLFSKIVYYLCVFSMIIPFQMVMFNLAKTADTLKLNAPWTIPLIYLGFGAGLAVFMFSGFIKSIPLEIEEAAAIDGCGPIRTFFFVVLPCSSPRSSLWACLR